MREATYWVEHLQLEAHPEGGFYKEIYRSEEKIPVHGLPERFQGERNFSTSIYFLLRSQDRSLFHRIKSDELWHFYAGTSLTLYVLTSSGLSTYQLGNNPEKGELLQLVIPANCWFGAIVNDANSFTLAGCTVSPGFDFQDFEMANRQQLLQQYPTHKEIIERLTQ